MLNHYSHIRMEAKRRAVNALVQTGKASATATESQNSVAVPKKSHKWLV